MSRRSDDDESLVERATHDLLNPVASLLGLGETLKARGGDLGDATIRSFGEAISRQAERLGGSVRDLARASRLLRGAPQVAVEEVDLVSLVGSFAGDRVRVEIPAGTTARANATLLEDALGRLVQNALDHSTEEVVVRAGRDGSVWIEVVDRGIGFTEEGLAGAFEPLAGGANARGERGSGLGLGLFIARALLEAMGGTLTATSAPGKGSVFRVELSG